MFDTLPQPDDRPFPAGIAPVQLVIFELDYQQERPPRSDDGLLWQKSLHAFGLETDRISPANQQALRLEGGGLALPRLVTVREGWVVHLKDAVSNSGLYPTGVNLERHNYPGFAVFRSECERVLDGALELLRPKVQTRLSLTYSNALSNEQATHSAFWRGKVHPAFLGPIVSDELLPNYSAGVSAFTFEADGCVADLKVAMQPDRAFEGRHAIVFQTEARMQQVQELARDEILQSLDALHVVLLKLFYAVVEPGYVQEMRAAEAKQG